MKKFILKGKVIQGIGGGKNFLDSAQVKRQIEEKLGFKPFPGTMNVRLSKESAEKRLELHNDKEYDIRPQVGSYPGILIKATIDAYDCAIVHPEDPNYPNDIVEIIAPVNLREKLNLQDGSEVTIEVQKSNI